jgi:hypothetical protein
VRQLGYQWAYIFTAIRPATGEDVTLVLPAVNGAAMQVFLDRPMPTWSWCSTAPAGTSAAT